MPRVAFSDKKVDIEDLAAHHYDVEAALRNYFGIAANSFPLRFAGYSTSDLAVELEKRLAELDMTSSLTILSSLEAVFRIDYLQRCSQKKKDTLSRAFRALYKQKAARVDLENEIFDLWKQHTNGSSVIIGGLKGAFKYRHWLAHGRYWKPKLGREYDFVSLYTLAASVLDGFPLLEP